MANGTGFTDKSSQDTRLGYLVQHRLSGKGLPPKHGGPQFIKWFGLSKIRLVPINQDLNPDNGIERTERIAGS